MTSRHLAAGLDAVRQLSLIDPAPRPVFYLGEDIGEARGWRDVLALLEGRGVPECVRASMIIHSRETPRAFHVGKPILRRVI